MARWGSTNTARSSTSTWTSGGHPGPAIHGGTLLCPSESSRPVQVQRPADRSLPARGRMGCGYSIAARGGVDPSRGPEAAGRAARTPFPRGPGKAGDHRRRRLVGQGSDRPRRGVGGAGGDLAGRVATRRNASSGEAWRSHERVRRGGRVQRAGGGGRAGGVTGRGGRARPCHPSGAGRGDRGPLLRGEAGEGTVPSPGRPRAGPSHAPRLPDGGPPAAFSPRLRPPTRPGGLRWIGRLALCPALAERSEFGDGLRHTVQRTLVDVVRNGLFVARLLMAPDGVVQI